MLPNFKTTAIAAITALSLAATSAAPAQALGKNERNFLKGVAATLIIGAILNDANARTRVAPAPAPEPYRGHTYERQPRQDEHRTTGRVIGSSGSVHATVAAQAFNSYGRAERRAIQTRLRGFGYYTGAIDGAFGPGTYRAVVAYARDTGGESQLRSQSGAYGLYDGLIY